MNKETARTDALESQLTKSCHVLLKCLYELRSQVLTDPDRSLVIQAYSVACVEAGIRHKGVNDQVAYGCRACKVTNRFLGFFFMLWSHVQKIA